MKYLSIDTETLGLNSEKHLLLEIGMIAADTEEKFELTHDNHLRIVLCHQSMVGDVYAFTMHTKLLNEIKDMIGNEFKQPEDPDNLGILLYEKDLPRTTYIENVVYINMADYLLEDISGDAEDEAYNALYAIIENFLLQNGIDISKDKINIAGKNFANFDAKFLNKYGLFNDVILKKSRHRVLDVGSMYVMPEDDCVPNLKQCLERAHIQKEVAHTSIDDALDVVNLIQAHFQLLRDEISKVV